MDNRVTEISKARGALLGAAVGDALGQPLEGHRAPGPRDIDLALAPDRDLRWTDDTALTIALAESLVDVGDLDEDRLAAAFARAWSTEPWRGFGARAATLFQAVIEGGSWRELARAAHSWGNGAAMRVAPIAVFAAGDIEHTLDLARRSALVTHTHPLGVDGAVAQAFAVASALRLGAVGRPVRLPADAGAARSRRRDARWGDARRCRLPDRTRRRCPVVGAGRSRCRPAGR